MQFYRSLSAYDLYAFMDFLEAGLNRLEVNVVAEF